MADGTLAKFIFKHHVPIQVVLAAATAYVGGIIVNSVSGDVQTGLPFWVYAASGFIVILLLTLISALFEKIIRNAEKGREREHSIHRTGYDTLNREMSEYICLSRDWNSSQTTT